MRRLFLILVLVLLAVAPAAWAGAVIDRAATALARDNVYVDPTAEAKLTPAQADEVRKRISARNAGPMYVAILPDAVKGEAGGTAVGVARAVRQRLGRQGIYVVIAGRSFAAGGSPGVSRVAREALQAHGKEGAYPILLAFVDGVGALGSGSGSGSGSGGGGGGIGVGTLLLIALLVLGGGAFMLSRRRRRQEEDAEFAEVRANARDDLVALGDDIRALDLDVEMPGADQGAKDAYARSVAAYGTADTAWQRARRPEDLEPVGAALEEGRWAMSVAKARMEGRPEPERRPPCFFDPRHGPSARDVTWTPPGGEPRPVPACEADAQRVERGEDPEAREVMVGGRSTPYWNAGPMYAPFAGGYFGGYGGGLFPGLLIGTLLGGAMFPGDGWGAEGWGGDGGDGGDWGGGDFGGGGGGDFGGGDFGGGGGDFGGGDF